MGLYSGNWHGKCNPFATSRENNQHNLLQVQGFAAGYFLWDLQISLQYMSIAGVSSLVHAIGALAVTCIGFVSLQNPCSEEQTNGDPETFRQLLWSLFRTLRALNALPQHTLVLRQTKHDWL